MLQTSSASNQASALAVAPVTSKAVNVHVTTSSQPQPDKRRVPAYIFKVKVINPSKKSDAVLRHLNGHTEQLHKWRWSLLKNSGIKYQVS